MKKSYLGTTISVVVTAFLITGCSSSSDSAPATSEATYTGIFVDAASAGVTFSCNDGLGNPISGVTNAEGKFSGCGVSSLVSFSVGNLSLGSMPYPVKGVFTPRAIAAASGGTPEAQQALANNIAATLLSLDDDGDSTNGINITPATVTAFNAGVTSGSNISDPAVVTAVNNTVTTLATQPGSTLRVVTSNEAASHMDETEIAIDAGDFDQDEPAVPAIVTGT